MNDQKLHEAFEDWARPLRDTAPPAVAVIRRRARRRIARLTVAGASALAVTGVAIGLLAGVVPGLGSPQPGPAISAARPFPAADPFLITLDNGGARAAIRNEASGKILRSLTPRPGTEFSWTAAAASDRLFVLAEQRARSGAARFYELRLGAAGQVLSFGPVPGTGTLIDQIYGLAVSPDGTEFAAATTPVVPGAPSGAVWVYGLTRGHPAQAWAASGGAPSTLSWAGDHKLAFYWQGNVDHRSGLRILDISASQGNTPRPLLSSSRLAVPAQNLSGSAQITADGSTVLTTVAEGSSGQAATRVRLGEFSAATGRLLRWLPLNGADQGLPYCGVLWSNASGSTLITQCGRVQQVINDGKMTRIHLPTTIPSGAVGYRNTFAW